MDEDPLDFDSAVEETGEDDCTYIGLRSSQFKSYSTST